MIQTLIEQLLGAWPSEIEAILLALQLAAPVLIVCLFVWLLAPSGQWLIDRYTLPRRGGMRTASQKQIERDVTHIYERWHDTVAPPEPRPRLRAGSSPVTPAADETRRRA